MANAPSSANFILRTNSARLRRFAELLEPATPAALEAMATRAHRLTLHHFGKTMRLFAPLYVSNECINSCQYCGFSRENPILRITLDLDRVEQEARFLASQGFRHLLLVSGEHPKFVDSGYLQQCIERLRPFIPSISVEVAPMEVEPYRQLVKAGAEGLVVYQETYHREIYAEMHQAGPKKDFDWRLACPERGYQAGFRRIGIGALFGLAPWREEALALAAHLDHLLVHCWKAFFTVSFPRLRPAAGEFEPRYPLDDRELVQLLCALRLTFPEVGIVMSTREPAPLRNALIPLGITQMSAGSHTEPGGYQPQASDDLHRTERGRIVAFNAERGGCQRATEQFAIADERSPAEIAQLLEKLGYEPVWKDWEIEMTAVGEEK